MATNTQAAAPVARPSRKGEILVTFIEMVAERGYDEVSLRDIAEALGMSKGTILHHYGSKDRLLAQAHADYMQRRLDEGHLILERVETPPRRLAALIYQLLLAQRDDRAATVAFSREIVRFQSDDLMSDVRAKRSDYFGLVRDVIREGMESGDFRTDEATLVTFQLFGMVNWMWTWLRPRGPWSTEEIARTYLNTFLGGLSAREDGHSLLASGEIGALVQDVMRQVADSAD